MLSTRLKTIAPGPRLELNDGTAVAATHILIAVGRKPPATDLALNATGVDVDDKLVAGRRRLLGNLAGGRILGATTLADRAGELIHEPALAMAIRMFTGRLAATSHAYPTWSMAVQLAAAQFFMPVDGRSARTVTAITEGA